MTAIEQQVRPRESDPIRRPSRRILRLRDAGGLLALILGLAVAGCSGGGATAERRPGLTPLVIKGKTVWVLLATTPTAIANGLMDRQQLHEDEGMLFMFTTRDATGLQVLEEAERSFYMKNTYIPLDIAYFNEDGVIKKILTMQVEENYTGKMKYRSEVPVSHALELNAGWFANNGVKEGDKIEGLPQLGGSGL